MRFCKKLIKVALHLVLFDRQWERVYIRLGSSQGQIGCMTTVSKAASFFRHFEKNSRTKKLKTQEKNSITQGKNSRFGQALKILFL